MNAELRPLAAEGAGTFLLVLIGPGAVMVDTLTGGGLGRLGVAVAFGAAVWIAVTLFGRVSGAHINPAVSLGLASAGRFAAAQVPAYVLAQCCGGILAALVLRVTLGDHAHLGATLPTVPIAAALAIEYLLSLALMTTVLWVTAGRRRQVAAAPLLGLVVGLCAWIGGPATGASMNPARSLGPALVSGTAAHHWIYWLAPIAGTMTAALLSGRKERLPS